MSNAEQKVQGPTSGGSGGGGAGVQGMAVIDEQKFNERLDKLDKKLSNLEQNLLEQKCRVVGYLVVCFVIIVFSSLLAFKGLCYVCSPYLDRFKEMPKEGLSVASLSWVVVAYLGFVVFMGGVVGAMAAVVARFLRGDY
jgi:hypothetical protein